MSEKRPAFIVPAGLSLAPDDGGVAIDDGGVTMMDGGTMTMSDGGVSADGGTGGMVCTAFEQACSPGTTAPAPGLYGFCIGVGGVDQCKWAFGTPGNTTTVVAGDLPSAQAAEVLINVVFDNGSTLPASATFNVEHAYEQLTFNSSSTLLELSLPNLTDIEGGFGIANNLAMTSLSFPALLRVAHHPAHPGQNLPGNLAFYFNTALTTILWPTAPSWTIDGSFAFQGNTAYLSDSLPGEAGNDSPSGGYNIAGNGCTSVCPSGQVCDVSNICIAP